MDDCQNAVLLLSLRQDLHELTKLARELTTLTNATTHSEITSWFFPSKSFPDILDVDNLNVISGYTSCLELILDRIYVIFNLIVLFLRGVVPKLSKKKSFCKPNKMTLASYTRIICKNILEKKNISNLARDNTEQQKLEGIRFASMHKAKLLTDRDTQTYESTSKNCNTCLMVLKCIKGIVLCIEKNLNNSQTKITREKLQVDLFNLSLFSCASEICHSLATDVEFLVKSELALRNEQSTICKEFKMCTKENEYLKKTLQSLEDAFAKSRIDLAQYTSLNETFELEKSKLFEMKTNIELQLKLSEEKLRKSRDENKKLLDKNNVVKNLEAENVKLVALANDFSIRVDILEEKIEDFKAAFVTIRNEFVRKEELNSKHMLSFGQHLITLYETIITKIVNGEVSNISLKNKLTRNENILVDGNPLRDMVKQIELNKKSMQKLEEENHSLLKIVGKLKELSKLRKH